MNWNRWVSLRSRFTHTYRRGVADLRQRFGVSVYDRFVELFREFAHRLGHRETSRHSTPESAATYTYRSASWIIETGSLACGHCQMKYCAACVGCCAQAPLPGAIRSWLPLRCVQAVLPPGAPHVCVRQLGRALGKRGPALRRRGHWSGGRRPLVCRLPRCDDDGRRAFGLRPIVSSAAGYARSLATAPAFNNAASAIKTARFRPPTPDPASWFFICSSGKGRDHIRGAG
jgi:hypothetical protein